MIRTNLSRMTMMSCIVLFCLFPCMLIAQKTYDFSSECPSRTGSLDIAQLMKQAASSFDADDQDAVILVDEQWIDEEAGGLFKTTVHTVVLIKTNLARDQYADHRILYDSAKQSFNVLALRTWRDNQWWDSDTTAIVETLPGGISKAYDYADMREMMLLHDGIELPCILEWAYVIEDKESFRKKDEGQWMFQRNDPVILSRFSLGYPKNRKPRFTDEDIMPVVDSITRDTPEEDGSVRDKLKSQMNSYYEYMTFTKENVTPLLLPHTVDPASYSPHITWSGWRSWDQYGKDLRKSFESAMELDNALRDSLKLLLKDAYALTEQAKIIADFVGRSTRLINYEQQYGQWHPRPAARTYNTAYGHRLDLAVLAAALFQEAGFMIFPVFLSEGYGDVNEGIASLSRMGGIGLWISGRDEVEAYYDPASSTVSNGLAPIYSRSIWIPGSGDDPAVTWRGEANRSRLEIRLHLSLDQENDQWIGKGFYKAEQGFNPFDQMEGVDSYARDYLQSVIAGVVGNAEIVTYNPVSFSRFTISAGLEFTAALGDPDDHDRISLSIGDPAGGIINRLPGDVELASEFRFSLLRLPGLMEQVVEIKLDTLGFSVLHIPENIHVENEKGAFVLNVDREGAGVTLSRTLSLTDVDCLSTDWKMLRSLLLAEKHEQGRRILLSRE